MQTNQSQEGAEIGARDELWETLGRHTAAGRTLFNLYCKSKPGAEAGRVYTERNRRILEACKNRGYRPPPPPALVPKAASDASSATGRAAKVAVPRCRGGASCDDDLDDWLHASGRQVGVRGRRPATEILKEQEKVEEELLNSCPPPPRGPLLDDQEKLRCARLMEWRGKLPEEELHEAAVQPPSQPLLTPASGAGHSPQNGLQALFDQVLMEVEERQKFLSEMKAYPKSEDSRRVVQQQLAERIETLKQLDRRLKEAEGLTARANADPNSSE